MQRLVDLAGDPLPSYLFLGPPGSGKFLSVHALMLMMMCSHGGCGRCEICQSIKDGHHPDILILRRAGQQLEVSEAREAVRFAAGVPNYGRWRMVVIPEIHRAALAAPILLKSIEEPPESTMFLLTAEGIGPGLEPVASRCLRVDVPRPTEQQIVAYLMGRGLEASAAKRVSPIAGGRLDRAEMLAEREDIQRYVDLWRSVPQRLRSDPHSLSELAWELESGASGGERKKSGRAGTPIEGAEPASVERRIRNDVFLVGLEAFLSVVIEQERSRAGEQSSTRLDPLISYRAVERAQSSLARNISISLVVRELVFELATHGRS
jgi:hypothetical protein